MEGIFIRNQSGKEITYCRNIYLEPFDDRKNTYAIIEKKGNNKIILGEYSEEKANQIFNAIWRNIVDMVSIYDMPYSDLSR